VQLFASWWERFPKREAAPTLFAVLVGFGTVTQTPTFVRMLASLTGFGWC
jgi:hypothetical protein